MFFLHSFVGILHPQSNFLTIIAVKLRVLMRITTVEHGRIITQKILGEHKVITAEQQFLGLILCI